MRRDDAVDVESVFATLKSDIPDLVERLRPSVVESSEPD
jgi:hypothetical protein